METKNKSLKGNIMLMLTALIWGTGFVSQSLGMEYIGPFTFNGVRNIIAAIFLIPCIYFLRYINKEEKKKMSPHEKKYLLKGGIYCGTVLFFASSFQQMGIQYTSVGKAGFITALYVIIVPVMGIFLNKKVSAKIWVSMAAAVFGLYLLCINEGFSINKGDLLILICAFLFSVHILVIDSFSPNTDGVKLSCIQFMVCGIISILPSAILEAPLISDIIKSMGPILYAAVFSSGIAYTLQVVGQKYTSPVIASLILSLESVFSAIFGWIILSQTLSTKEIIGCIIVFAAIINAQIPEKIKTK